MALRLVNLPTDVEVSRKISQFITSGEKIALNVYHQSDRIFCSTEQWWRDITVRCLGAGSRTKFNLIIYTSPTAACISPLCILFQRLSTSSYNWPFFITLYQHDLLYRRIIYLIVCPNLYLHIPFRNSFGPTSIYPSAHVA